MGYHFSYNRHVKKAAAAAAVFLTLCCGLSIFYPDALKPYVKSVFSRQSVTGEKGRPLVMLDPGHGGFDGGAESADGVCEKNINLNIALKMRDILEENDISVVMTRETDCGLYSSEKGSVRSRKSEDLHARLEMAEKLEPDAFVSIHLNSFKEDRSVYGAQTFYTTSCAHPCSEMSRQLAELIQSLLIAHLDDGNTRTAMEKNDVLIMKEAVCPTVIIECGFLSNYAEAEKLKKQEYQDKIAHAAATGIMTFFGIDPKEKPDSGIEIIESR